MLILLDGTSSAGKTTLAKAVQDALPTPYLLLGIDTVVFALPRRYVNESAFWSEVYQYRYDVTVDTSSANPAECAATVAAAVADH